MAIEGEQVSVTLKPTTRTFRFVGLVPYGAEPSIEVNRETLYLDAKGVPFGPPVVTAFMRSWSEMKDKSWKLQDGTTVTAAEIFEALALAFDEEAQAIAAQVSP